MGVTPEGDAQSRAAKGALTIVQTTGSTNDDVMELGRAGAAAGTAIASHEQTVGRGRRGHVWGSPDTGLYISILLRPQVPMHYLLALSAVSALGVQDALKQLGATNVLLKWPNDVVVPGKNGHIAGKLCGILVEAGTGDAGMFAVSGIGVNLKEPEIDLSSMGSARPLKPAALPDAMGSDENGAKLPVPGFDELAQAITDCVVARCDEWEAAYLEGRAAAGPMAPILDEYFDQIELINHEVEAVLPDGRVCGKGTFVGLDVWGRATIRTESGEELEFASEQASLRAV